MTTIIDKREHEELDYEEIGNHVALDGIPMANCGTPDRLLGLTVTDIKARTLRTGYYIGAAWIAEGDTALRVSPKIEGIDWLRMFTDCFYEADGEIQKHIHKIYQIDFDKPKIEYNGGTSMLTPFIIAHFLFLVKNIVRKGLKKDYRHEEQKPGRKAERQASVHKTAEEKHRRRQARQELLPIPDIFGKLP